MKHLIRLKLTRNSDRKVYLDRWGISTRFGGIMLHHITAPDPGHDVHDHPWWFASWILKGGYTEEVVETRLWDQLPKFRTHKRWSWHVIRLDQAHRINQVRDTWTLVVKGPLRRTWGFYRKGTGFIRHNWYDHTGLMEERNYGLD